jgi:hypothetical protein
MPWCSEADLGSLPSNSKPPLPTQPVPDDDDSVGCGLSAPATVEGTPSANR